MSAASEAGKSAVDALREAIDAHSPSHLTAEAGEDFDEGFYMAIRKDAMKAAEEASRMGDVAVSALADRGYGTKSHARTVASTSKTANKAVTSVEKALSKQTEATNSLASQMSAEASYTPKAKAAVSSTVPAGISAVSGGVSNGGNISAGASDLGGLIETYARLVATALNGVTVELEGEEVGSLVAPVVSTIIAQNAVARSNGTV